MPRRDHWEIVTLSAWLSRHPAEDVLRARALIFEYQHRATEWFNGFVDHQGSILLLIDGATILGLSSWRFPAPARNRDGSVFGDIGLIPDQASLTGARALVQQTVTHLRDATRRHHRSDLRITCMHTRIDDQRLLKLCLQAGFTRHGILANRYEDFGSYVETYMLELLLHRPH